MKQVSTNKYNDRPLSKTHNEKSLSRNIMEGRHKKKKTWWKVIDKKRNHQQET